MTQRIIFFLIYDILELWLIQLYIKYEQFFFYLTVT